MFWGSGRGLVPAGQAKAKQVLGVVVGHGVVVPRQQWGAVQPAAVQGMFWGSWRWVIVTGQVKLAQLASVVVCIEQHV